MNEVTHVCEIRFYDLDEVRARRIRNEIAATLRRLGYGSVAADLVVHPVATVAQFLPRTEDKPSAKQVSYLRYCLNELELAVITKEHSGDTTLEVRLARSIYDTVSDLFKQQPSKQRIGELIDAVKEASQLIADRIYAND